MRAGNTILWLESPVRVQSMWVHRRAAWQPAQVSGNAATVQNKVLLSDSFAQVLFVLWERAVGNL